MFENFLSPILQLKIRVSLKGMLALFIIELVIFDIQVDYFRLVLARLTRLTLLERTLPSMMLRLWSISRFLSYLTSRIVMHPPLERFFGCLFVLVWMEIRLKTAHAYIIGGGTRDILWIRFYWNLIICINIPISLVHLLVFST